MSTIGLYAKALAAAVVAGLSAYATALPESVSSSEVVGIIITTLIALGAVWAVPNMPTSIARYGKAIVSGLVAAGGVLGTALAAGALVQGDVVTAVIAFLVGSGLVVAAPNAKRTDYGLAA